MIEIMDAEAKGGWTVWPFGRPGVEEVRAELSAGADPNAVVDGAGDRPPPTN
jgi:hypothetical protein